MNDRTIVIYKIIYLLSKYKGIVLFEKQNRVKNRGMICHPVCSRKTEQSECFRRSAMKHTAFFIFVFRSRFFQYCSLCVRICCFMQRFSQPISVYSMFFTFILFHSPLLYNTRMSPSQKDHCYSI